MSTIIFLNDTIFSIYSSKNHSRPLRAGAVIIPRNPCPPPCRVYPRDGKSRGRPGLGAQQRARPSARRSEPERLREGERCSIPKHWRSVQPRHWAFVSQELWGVCERRHWALELGRRREAFGRWDRRALAWRHWLTAGRVGLRAFRGFLGREL